MKYNIFVLFCNTKHILDVEEKKDGTIELVIISSDEFDDTIEQQTLPMDKVENYISYVLSDEFANTYKNYYKEKVWIILKLSQNLVKN